MKASKRVRLADAPDVLTVEQYAAVMQMGRRQAYEAVRRGDVYAVRIGRSWRIPKAALIRQLQGDEPASAA